MILQVESVQNDFPGTKPLVLPFLMKLPNLASVLGAIWGMAALALESQPLSSNSLGLCSAGCRLKTGCDSAEPLPSSPPSLSPRCGESPSCRSHLHNQGFDNRGMGIFKSLFYGFQI